MILLKDISKNFSDVRALDNINQEIVHGEFFTLLGPSGCGKTTLLRTIAGFQTQDSGHLYISEKLIDNVPAHQRDTGMVFQNYAIFPHMTVFENVAFGLKSRKCSVKEIKERVARALERVGLSGYENRTPDQLSGGQQQRVGLARAMVIEPQALLMDEPLSNLDAKLRVKMRDEIRSVQKELRITTIYVTHDQEEALAISDRIAVMNYGVIQQVGTPWEIYKNPANIFVATFVGDMSFIDGEIINAGKDTAHIAVGAQKILVNAKLPSKKIRIATRPEDIEIDLKKTSKENESSIPGVVKKSSFLGSLVKYYVDYGKESPLIVKKYTPLSAKLIPDGTPIHIKIPTDAMLYFDSETGMRI